MFIQNNH